MKFTFQFDSRGLKGVNECGENSDTSDFDKKINTWLLGTK